MIGIQVFKRKLERHIKRHSQNRSVNIILLCCYFDHLVRFATVAAYEEFPTQFVLSVIFSFFNVIFFLPFSIVLLLFYLLFFFLFQFYLFIVPLFPFSIWSPISIWLFSNFNLYSFFNSVWLSPFSIYFNLMFNSK